MPQRKVSSGGIVAVYLFRNFLFGKPLLHIANGSGRTNHKPKHRALRRCIIVEGQTPEDIVIQANDLHKFHRTFVRYGVTFSLASKRTQLSDDKKVHLEWYPNGEDEYNFRQQVTSDYDGSSEMMKRLENKETTIDTLLEEIESKVKSFGESAWIKTLYKDDDQFVVEYLEPRTLISVSKFVLMRVVVTKQGVFTLSYSTKETVEFVEQVRDRWINFIGRIKIRAFE